MKPTPPGFRLLLGLLVLIAGCKTAPIYQVADHRVDAPSEERVAEAIRRAATLYSWSLEQVDERSFIATKKKGQHVAQVTIAFDNSQFTITYRNSVLLKYAGDRIHKAYNGWVRDLETAIHTELGGRVPVVGAGEPPRARRSKRR